MTFFACSQNYGGYLGEATSVVVSKSKLDLHVGETATLTATVHPTSLGMPVTWSSLDETIATVEEGVVTAVAKGVTYVVATSDDGTQKGACMVSVNPEIRYSIAVKDQLGRTLTGIYGYPGQTMQLTAYTSDEQDHQLTMTLGDNSVGTLAADGTLTLAAKPSTEVDFMYDAQSFLRIVSEDGYIYTIPVRSSLYAGIRFNGEFKNLNSSVAANASQIYPIAALYQGENAPIAITAEAASLELTNTTDFSLKVEDNAYTLVTAANTGVETSISITLPNGTKHKIADILIEKYYEIKASLTNTSSSTLIFTWSEPDIDVNDWDNAYTATLYKDSECTIVDQSFDFPAGLGAWRGKTPKYIFGGLQPGTEYYLKVYDTTNNYESNKVKATTDAFTHVLMPETITGPGVVLAEDFGEIRCEFDHITTAVGFRPADKSDFASTEVKTSENNSGNYIYDGYHYSGGGEIEYKSFGTAIENSRLNGWLSDTKAYVHPGYIKLGTSSSRGWMVTPEFTVPEGKKAVVKVTVTAARINNSQDADWGLIVLNPELACAGKQGAHTAYFEWPDTNDNTLYQTITIDSTNWMTKSIEGLVIRPNDRIAFGGKYQGAETAGRISISDMTVEVIEILNE